MGMQSVDKELVNKVEIPKIFGRIFILLKQAVSIFQKLCFLIRKDTTVKKLLLLNGILLPLCFNEVKISTVTAVNEYFGRPEQ